MSELGVGETKAITATHEPAEAHIASYAWSEDSGGAVLALQADGDAATVTGVAAGSVRVTVSTVNADGTPGPGYSEDVTVTAAAAPAAPAETGADTVRFEWSDAPAETEPEGAEVAPTPDEYPVTPAAWSGQTQTEETSYGA